MTAAGPAGRPQLSLVEDGCCAPGCACPDWIVVMPLLGWAKRRLGTRLGSAATAGEGTQNYLCAAQAATVLAGLAVTAAWPGGWWADPAIGLLIAAATVWEGIKFWRGDDCC